MSTTLPSLPSGSRLRPRYFVFGFIFLMMAYVLNHNERFIFDSSDPVWQHYNSFKLALLFHGTAAGCALLLGPMQFSDRLRQRFTKFHRVIGRIYVIGVLIGAPIGIYIQYIDEGLGGTRSFTIATAVDATLWISCTLIALAFAMNGKINQHRQWMTRSYACAIIFLEVRVISGVFGLDGSLQTAETIVWCCVACAVPLADFVLQLQELIRSRASAQKAAQARTAVA